MTLDTLTRLLALAAGLESEGQYNNAKLLRAAVDALLTRAAHELRLPGDKAALLAESERAIAALAALDLPGELTDTMRQAHAALAEGRLPRYADVPDPFVCRICGRLLLAEAEACPGCGAQFATLKRFRAIYWLEAFDAQAALAHLRATPKKAAALLSKAEDAQAEQPPEGGGWSLRQAAAHLRDAQGVLAMRVDLLLDQENPALEAKAVFAWAADAQATTEEIFETYRASRAQTLARLENLSPADWRRRGRHEEFGEVSLLQQASYFACHELTHLPQIELTAYPPAPPAGRRAAPRPGVAFRG